MSCGGCNGETLAGGSYAFTTTSSDVCTAFVGFVPFVFCRGDSAGIGAEAVPFVVLLSFNNLSSHSPRSISAISFCTKAYLLSSSRIAWTMYSRYRPYSRSTTSGNLSPYSCAAWIVGSSGLCNLRFLPIPSPPSCSSALSSSRRSRRYRSLNASTVNLCASYVSPSLTRALFVRRSEMRTKSSSWEP